MCLSSKLGLSNSFPQVSQGSNLLDLVGFTAIGNEKSRGLGIITFGSSSLSFGDSEPDSDLSDLLSTLPMSLFGV